MSPESKIETIATRAGFRGGDVQGGHFSLRYFRNFDSGSSAKTSVYLDGDGSPWVRPTRVSGNPTPRHPLALHMMAHDPGDAIYLSRPCYHGRQNQIPCRPWLWSHGRYSPQVVDALTLAITKLIREFAPGSRVRLIGHSGGGVLAMLIAERLAAVSEVITIAANLDVAAWAEFRNYSRLQGSLNPAVRPDLPGRITQVHFVGGKDEQVPAKLTAQAIRDRSEATLVRVESFDHHCCWVDYWERLLLIPDNVLDWCAESTAFDLPISCIAGKSERATGSPL